MSAAIEEPRPARPVRWVSAGEWIARRTREPSPGEVDAAIDRAIDAAEERGAR